MNTSSSGRSFGRFAAQRAARAPDTAVAGGGVASITLAIRGDWSSAQNSPKGAGATCSLFTRPQDDAGYMVPHRLVRAAKPQATTPSCEYTTSTLTVKAVSGCWFERFHRVGSSCIPYSDTIVSGGTLCAGTLNFERVIKTNNVNVEYSFCYVANPSPDVTTRVRQEATCWDSGSKVVSGTFVPSPPGTTRTVELRP